MPLDDEDVQVYEKYADELIRFASAVVGPSNAEDVLSEAMLHVFASPRWKAVTRKRAYLYRAVLNEAIAMKRSSDRRLRRETEAARHGAASTDEVDVHLALLRLTVRQRAVVYLTYWIGVDAQEVAKGLDISVRTVERELTAARRRLEALLR